MTTAEQWAEWLQKHLDDRGWRQADFVRESEGHIKRDRVSKWLRGIESPSHRLAIVTANTLGIDRNEALRVAGFDVEFEAPDWLKSEWAARDRWHETPEGKAQDEQDYLTWAAQNPQQSGWVSIVSATREDAIAVFSDDELLAEVGRRLARASEAAPSVSANGTDVATAVHGRDEGTKSAYGLAAKRGRRKADQPHAE